MTHILCIIIVGLYLPLNNKREFWVFLKCTSEDDWSKCERISKKESRAAGITETLHDKKTSHIEDLKLGLQIILIILLILLLLGM